MAYDNMQLSMEYSLSKIMQRVVDEVCEKGWAHDECPPKFTVSINADYKYEDSPCKLFLTCSHNGSVMTRHIDFRKTCPSEDDKNIWNEFNLYDFMQLLYNCTM